MSLLTKDTWKTIQKKNGGNDEPCGLYLHYEGKEGRRGSDMRYTLRAAATTLQQQQQQEGRTVV